MAGRTEGEENKLMVLQLRCHQDILMPANDTPIDRKEKKSSMWTRFLGTPVIVCGCLGEERVNGTNDPQHLT